MIVTTHPIPQPRASANIWVNTTGILDTRTRAEDGTSIIPAGTAVHDQKPCEAHTSVADCLGAEWSPCLQPERLPDQHMRICQPEHDCTGCGLYRVGTGYGTWTSDELAELPLLSTGGPSVVG